MMFVDVDLPERERPPSLGTWLKGIFGGGKAEVPNPAPVQAETELLAKAERVVQRQSKWGWRIYRTRAGFRLLATHRLFEPGTVDSEPVFDELGADPLYRQLCKSQKCFRARLTPKAWRCKIPLPPSWPWPDARAEERFKKWEVRYLAACHERATCELIATLGNPQVPTLVLQGDTGTGKGLVARIVHDSGPRAGGPFIEVNCAAIPDTLLESELFGYEKGAFSGADRRKDGLLQVAQAGTLLLDEVGNLPPGTQAKLLRVLQERQVLPLGSTVPRKLDARFIFATNVPLEEAAKEGRFRADLFYRLAEFTITVPPLRERGRDILLLARRFLDEANAELRRAVAGFDEVAAEELLAHPWPGNVRELRNVVERVMILEDDETITPRFLPRGLAASETRNEPVRKPSENGDLTGSEDKISRQFHLPDEGISLDSLETSLVQQAMSRSGGNQTRAADLLGITRDQLRYRLKKIGVES